MLKTLLIRESERQEYYTVDINGKMIHVYIEKGDDGAVFTIEDHGVYLADTERFTVLEELKTLSIDFSSRRIFGSYRPKEINSARASNSRGVSNRYKKRFLKS
jgi:hypothetical protein